MFPDEGFDDLRRQVEQLRRLGDSMDPLMRRIILDQQRLRNLTRSATEHLFDDQEQWRGLLHPVVEQAVLSQQVLEEVFDVTQLRKLGEHLRGPALVAEQLKQAIAPIDLQSQEITRAGKVFQELGRQIEEVSRVTALDFDGLHERLKRAEIARERFEKRAAAFDAAETLQERERIACELLAAVAAWVRTLPASALAAIRVRRVVAFVILFILPQVQWIADRRADAERDRATATERERDRAWKKELDAQVSQLSEATNALTPAVERPIYEATRALPLRSAPHKDGRRLATVPACALLEEVGSRGRWLQVVSLDLDSGHLQQGWVYQRHIVRVDVAVEDVDDPCADDPLGTE